MAEVAEKVRRERREKQPRFHLYFFLRDSPPVSSSDADIFPSFTKTRAFPETSLLESIVSASKGAALRWKFRGQRPK